MKKILVMQFAILLFLFAASTSQAAPTLSTKVILYPGASAIDKIIWENAETSSMSRNLFTSFGSSTYDASASATSTYGSLGASAQLSISNYPSQSYFVPCEDRSNCGVGTYHGIGLSAASAMAGFDDDLTLSGGFGEAFIVFEFDVEGSSTISSTGGVSSSAGFYMQVNSVGEFGLVNYGTSQGPRHLVSRPLAVTYNDPFNLDVNFHARIDAFDIDDPDSGSYDYDVLGTAEFGGTATLTGFQLYADKALQNEITAFTISSASGTVYPGSINVVPEPISSTLFLLGSAVFGLFGYKKRKCKA